MISSREMCLATLVVLSAGVTACGGDETPASPEDETTTTSTVVDESAEGVSAEIVVEGVTYTFSEGSCSVTIAGDVVSEFSNGDDDLNFTSVNHSLLIRATLGGEQWVEPRGALEADGSDASNVTWAGELLRQGTAEPLVAASITLHC